ncbi:hypothetical protein COCVIDRAFT_43137 [Bipolaris victoriae FI3]|uniref:Uncharacterized protein n=1 Tax=Bipolaris victoriae (strain FI3) TaxID=930091 RepID=W7E412_BIPV3|nr:hypothetical protein COCVIDRAFT_43137 [Bipolaris victoriae FI3]
MLSPLVDLPSRLERARVEHSEEIAVGATGFQPAMHEVLQKPSLLEPSNLPKDSIFTYFQEETEKKDGASCVFLLWGSEHSESFKTWAVDVLITDVEDEYDIFKSLKKKLKPVTFWLICRPSKRFLAFVEPLDLDSLHKSYSEQQGEAMKAIELIIDFDSTAFPHDCYRDSSGEYHHSNSDCLTNSSKLSGVLTFNDFRPQNRYLELGGLYVETAWCPRKCLYAFLGILFSVLTGGKLFWGSWEVIFGAGSFIVALPMLVLTVLSCYDV